MNFVFGHFSATFQIFDSCQSNYSGLFDQLESNREVFQCAIGDIDYSFSFKYHSAGKWIRNYEVSNRSCSKDDLKVEINIGEPLNGESIFLDYTGTCVYEKVINILYEQGLKFPINAQMIKSYSYTLSKLNDQ